MRKVFLKHSVIAVPFLLSLFFFAGVTDVRAAKNFGLTTTNQLISFNTPMPGNVTTIGPITGLQAGEIILGIDTRPATGELYGLGSTSRIYKINKTTGAAAAVGAPFTPALSGTNFGFDFNPTVDRIRIVSDAGQNLRANPNDGTVIVDGTINPGSPTITAAAYFNNFAGATSTILYVIDTANDTLYQQSPANDGTLLAVGALGVDASDVNGFDYNSGDNTALAALTVGGVSNIYRIDVVFGTATLIGAVGGNVTLRGLTGDIAQQTQSFTAIGLTTTNQLVTFNTARPDMITSTVSITGLQSGENIVGIDFRATAGGQLFGIGSLNRVYMINAATGAAAFVGNLTTALSGTKFGVDFNPTVDRIRIVSDADQNLRANPNDGTNLVDGTLAYGAGDPNAGQNPNIVAAAYTNSVAGATTTALFDIDSNLDIVVQQNPANAGTLQTITPLGLDATNNVGYDIEGVTNTGFAAIQLNGDSSSKFYIINTNPMSPATFIGQIGGQANRVLLSGLAVVGGGGPAPRAAALNLLDFTGDARADYAVFRPSNNFWYINPSSSASNLSFTGQAFGNAATDVPTPGDYDGDGKTDLAVWRRTNGTFYVLRSSDNSLMAQQFGQNGDEPVARDYDGDRKTDYAVVRKINGSLVWFILNSGSNNGFRAEQFGTATDVVAPGDYDGDGKFDLAVFRGTGDQPAVFYVKRSSDGGLIARQFGLGSDTVVPGDYDGDGKTDFAVVRTGSSYQWYVLRSSNNSLYSVQLGSKPDFPTQNDYDGDGKTDVSVYKSLTGAFYVIRSTDGGVTARQFGQNGDYPIASYDAH